MANRLIMDVEDTWIDEDDQPVVDVILAAMVFLRAMPDTRLLCLWTGGDVELAERARAFLPPYMQDSILVYTMAKEHGYAESGDVVVDDEPEFTRRTLHIPDAVLVKTPAEFVEWVLGDDDA